MSTRQNLAVIGCGLRADCYMHELRCGLGKEWRLLALADPNPLAIDVFRRNYGQADVRTYRTGPELLNAHGPELDAVIIASPNAFHIDAMIPALRHRLKILLEKPVATRIKDCAAIWQAYLEAGQPPVIVGFVLRYTAFYQKIRELLDKGAIGQMLSMEAAELMGIPLSALYMRGWRRQHDLAGPLVLEKCSHDLDILSWLAGAKPVRVASFAGRTRFIPNPRAAGRCRDCALRDACRYSSGKVVPYLMNIARRDEILPLIPTENDLCVFNSEKDIPDHQVASIEYANGVLASFTVCLDQPRSTRTIRINGTLGQIIGDIGRDELRVEYHPPDGSEQGHAENIRIEHDASGHHGGDSVIADQFKSIIRGEAAAPLAGLREGIESSLVSLAIETASRENRVVPMSEWERPFTDGIRRRKSPGKIMVMLAALLWLGLLAGWAGPHYVAHGGQTPAPDYTDWTTAASNIQDAISVSTAGDTVLVSNGVYETGGITNWPGGTLLTNRVAITNAITVRSANNDPANTIIKGAWNPATTNGPAAVRCVFMTNNSSLIGFMLTNGATLTAAESANADDRNGGGVWCNSANTTISNCVIAGNSADYRGAGVYGGDQKGALYNCAIIRNAGTAYGGGTYKGNLIQCVLIGNSAWTAGGGTYAADLSLCTLVSNAVYSASGYGGGAGYGTLTNCILTGNAASVGQGGGTYQSVQRNCTMAGNSAKSGGGAGTYNSTLYNCISWGNNNTDVAQIAYYSCGVGYTNGGSVLGNVTNNPMFVDANVANYRLGNNSPCINAGTNQSWMTNFYDLDKVQRIRYGVVDMGAYERVNAGTVYTVH